MRLLILFLLFPFIALAQDISEYEKLVEVATAFVNNKAYEKAINSLDKAIEMDETQLLAYYERGKINYKIDAHKEAIIDFEKVATIKPSFYFAYVYIADCKMKLGDFKGAKESYEQAFNYNNKYKFRAAIVPKYRQAKLAEIENAKTKLDTEVLEAPFMGYTIMLSASDILTCSETIPHKAQLREENQLLDVNFTMNDAPIENGLFIFGVETEENKNLTFELFEKETNNLLMQCTFGTTQGNNYKALNVSRIASGSYTFRIYNEDMKELYRTLSIKH